MKKLSVYTLCSALALSVSACSWTSESGSEGESGGAVSSTMASFRNAFSFGKAPQMREGESVDTWCPPIDVSEGGANIRIGSRDTVSTQVTLRHFSRECILQQDDNVRVKVGVLGYALLGPGGRAGTIRAPVHMIIKDGNKIIAQRVSSPSVSISGDTARGEFYVVEDNIIVPAASAYSFEIEVGLGSGRKKR